MKIPLYLALFSSEFLTCPKLPQRPAWMACHFSSGGVGLTNIPASLPPGSLLIFDDSTPYQAHDCDLILSQLAQAVSATKPDAVLLDFQRPNIEAVQSLADAIVKHLPCPVVVSSCYADTLECPIFLPPPPLDQPLESYVAPYNGRQVWLDAAPISAQIIVTNDSSQYIPRSDITTDGTWHYDDQLHCHYHIQCEQEQIVFTLSRRSSDLVAWLNDAERLGVYCAVGLYQELSEII